MDKIQTIYDIYEKYKHLDKLFSDTIFVETCKDKALYEMWDAIKYVIRKE